MRKMLAITFALAIAGCATPPPISTNPLQTVTSVVLPAGGTVLTGLQNAAFNLDEAVLIGVLPATDPAAGCVHGVLKQIGADVVLTMGVEMPVPGAAAAATFTPKITDLLSAGSVAYILAQQAKQIAANPGILVPVSCDQIVGQFVIQSINAPANAVISAAVKLVP